METATRLEGENVRSMVGGHVCGLLFWALEYGRRCGIWMVIIIYSELGVVTLIAQSHWPKEDTCKGLRLIDYFAD